MSNSSTFLPPGLSHNPNTNHTNLMDHFFQSDFDFDLSDYLIPNQGSSDDFTSSDMLKEIENSATYSGDTPTSCNMPIKYKQETKKSKKEVGSRIAFRMKSELEIIDDGFKWRKYGKKRVKNSPNPRNYYRCSSGGCHVKKRVERDSEDSSYVITTYDGVHNHESPCVIYYNETPLMVPNGWTLQASHHSPS